MKPLSIDQVKKLIEDEGYELLNTYHVIYNSGKKNRMVKIKCKGNHIREIRLDERKRKCRECAIDSRIKETIQKRGGTFVKYVFKSKRKYVNFICKNGHNLTLVSHDVDHRCKKCTEEEIEEKVRKIIEERGGMMLNTFVKNKSTRFVNFLCKKEHECTKNVSEMINRGSWCKRCNESKYETKVREIFKDFYDMDFNPKFPKWLINPKSKRLMQLDGYEPSLKLAFEYDGQQHYEFVKYYHKTQDKFRERVEKDACKSLLCLHKGIKLIRIPYFIKYEELEEYVLNKIKYVES